MNALDRCLAELFIVINTEHDEKVIIAEHAIDGYVKNFSGDFHAQLDALQVLETHLTPLIPNVERSAILARIDNWRRTIAKQMEDAERTDG